jgi:hypothetical protein
MLNLIDRLGLLIQDEDLRKLSRLLCDYIEPGTKGVDMAAHRAHFMRAKKTCRNNSRNWRLRIPTGLP